MEPTKKFYVALTIIIVLLFGFVGYIGYTIYQSDTFKDIKNYDIEYETCVTQCDNIISIFQEDIDRCKEKCLMDYKQKKGIV